MSNDSGLDPRRSLVPRSLLRLRGAFSRALPTARRIDLPTYTQDVVGAVHQWDERDSLFARRDLFRHFGPEAPECKAYYEAHAESLEYDKAIHGMGELGRTGGVDAPMFRAQFNAVKWIAAECCVDGLPAGGQSHAGT